jgi:hypothetical protein
MIVMKEKKKRRQVSNNIVDTYPILQNHEFKGVGKFLNFIVSRDFIDKGKFDVLFSDVLKDERFMYYQLQYAPLDYYYSNI